MSALNNKTNTSATTVTLAKTAGFCFGVNRAVSMVYRLLEEGKPCRTFGPIIHNPQIVADLSEKGAGIVQEFSAFSNLPADTTLVLRSHGIPKAQRELLIARGVPIADATCPFVAKIHRIVAEASAQGKIVLIAGDASHPEVEGIQSYCSGESYIFRNADELQIIFENHPEFVHNAICIVAQTTFEIKEWKKCLKNLKILCTNASIFDTICSATSQRQQEAAELAKRSELMIIVGGRQSSNTAKLCRVCSEFCKAIQVESADELPAEEIRAAHSIGVTAGASTPADIIKEVLNTMSEILNEVNVIDGNGAEDSFEAMLEESLKTLNTDEKVLGVVVGIAPNEVYVDVGRKQAGFIPLNELSDNPSAKPEDLVKIGDKINLLIMRTNDQEGTIMLSKKRYDANKGWDIVCEAAKNNDVLTGTVTEVIKGGVIVFSNGCKVFIPASQATANRGDALDDLLKTEVSFRVLEANINRGKRHAVGSIRSVLNDRKKEAEAKFWETAQEGMTYQGTVKTLTNYGAFVDIGGVDGMVHISELSWNHIKNPAEVLSVGDSIEVFILKLDAEKKKISLGYKKAEDNPWEIMKNQYPVDTVTDVKIVGVTDFGAFARIIPGVDGLIHISQISNQRINKPADVLSVGDVVKAKITAVDFEKKRVSLSIKALLENAEEPAEEAAAEPAEAESAE